MAAGINVEGTVMTDSMLGLGLGALSLLATLILCLVLMPLARRSGWLDQPDARKLHARPTPLVGGVAVFVVFFGVQIVAGAWLGSLLVASLVVLLTGLADDRWPLSAAVRFAAQAAACFIMIYWAGIRLDDFGELFGPFTLNLGMLAVPITVFSALGVINAFNMIDGLDGLAGGVFVVAASAMTLLATLAGRADAVPLLIPMIGAVLGYLLLNARLPWNRRARVFLGDGGSMLLGFWLAWFFVDLGNGSRVGVERAFAPMTAVWLIGVPLLDTTRLIGNRWRAGKSAFEADRRHLHHAFLAAGFTVGQTWWGIVGLCAVFAGVGVVLERSGVPDYVSFYAFVAVGYLYLRVMRRTWREARFLGRPFRLSNSS
jgi:UDP-GlcNAc:undecaprenyl-phosphate GlcNAc-1-phosphate transferase